MPRLPSVWLSLALLGVLTVGPARAEAPVVTSVVEQSGSLSMMEKIKFVEGAVSTTQGWITSLEDEKAKVEKDRSLTDDERKAIIACYDHVLTPLRSLFESIRKSANTMQAYFAESDEAHADLEFRKVAVVYKLATEKQAESLICTSSQDDANGDQVTSVQEPDSSATSMDDVAVPPVTDVSPT